MKAYISHSKDDDIAPLRDFLAEQRISVLDTSNPSVSDPISEVARASIRAADMVFAILRPEAVEVFFELGIAFGLHKPILLLVGPGTPVPAFVMGVRYLISGSLDSDLVRIGIRKFVDEVESGTSRPRRPKVSEFSQQVSVRALRKFVVQLKNLRKSKNASDVERFVADLIRATGITALEAYAGPKDRGVDLAVWSDALDSSLGNPILFEIKAGKLNERTILQTFDRLARQVAQSDAGLGVLLYLDKDGRRFKVPMTSHASVLSFELEDFLQELLKKPFANVLAERRNEIVHKLSD